MHIDFEDDVDDGDDDDDDDDDVDDHDSACDGERISTFGLDIPPRAIVLSRFRCAVPDLSPALSSLLLFLLCLHESLRLMITDSKQVCSEKSHSRHSLGSGIPIRHTHAKLSPALARKL